MYNLVKVTFIPDPNVNNYWHATVGQVFVVVSKLEPSYYRITYDRMNNRTRRPIELYAETQQEAFIAARTLLTVKP
jgi:hypothetical protein